MTGSGFLGAYFDWPTRVVQRRAPILPGELRRDYQGMAALPFGTVIGAELIGQVDWSTHFWWPGFTNTYDLTVQYGNHEAGVIVVVWCAAGICASGEALAKEAVLAVEFYVEGQPHYGYIHFDFRLERGWLLGAGGYIYGWAYETAPGVPITAERIRNGPPVLEFKVTSIQPWPDQSGRMLLIWNAVAGSVYRIEASEDLVTWSDLSGDVVAQWDSMHFITAPSAAGRRFFRIQLVN